MAPFGIEVETLPFGVDPGIGAAAALKLNGRIEDLCQRGFNMVLYGCAAGLALPPVEVGAVIGANTFPTHLVMDSCQCEIGCKAAFLEFGSWRFVVWR